MKLPPMFAVIDIHRDIDEEGCDGFSLWLPLFIIVPVILIILLAIFLVILPFLLIALIFTWEASWWRWLVFAVPALFRALYEIGGLKVDIEDGSQKVFINVR